MNWQSQGAEDARLVNDDVKLEQERGSADMVLPQRKDEAGLGNASHVLSSPLRCYPNSPLEFHAFKVRLLKTVSGNLRP